MRISCAIGLFMSFLICPALLAQKHTQWFDPSKHMSIDKVKPGMKGYGLSIFYGTKIERFEVEVRDVIKNFEPKRDAILVYLSGQDLERTGVIQGMSGSPVYLQDPEDGKYKIAGAVAFGWAFSRPGPAICGIQPIEEMLAVPPVTDGKPILVKSDKTFFPQALKVMASRSADHVSSLENFDRFVWSGMTKDVGEFAAVKQKNASGTMGLIPLATPLGVSGITADTFTRLSTVLSPLNLTPIKTGSPSAGSDAADSPMIPAGVLAVPLASGDLSLAAIGTVTDVVGDHVWGFGHSFFAQGPMELPLAAGTIHAIIPSLQSSFKLGSPAKPIGTLYSDENTAVAGKIGAVPTLSPLDVTVNFNGVVETYHYDMAMHERLTPLLTMVCVMNSVVNHKELPELHVVRYSGSIEFENFKPIEFANVSSDMDLGMLLADIAEPVNMMMNNEFKRVKFKKINVNVAIEPKSIQAELKQVRLNRQEYRPGETAKVEMLLSQIRGPEFTKTIEFTVPEDLPDGEYALSLGGLRTAMQSDRQSHPYIYKTNSVEDIYRMMTRVLGYRADCFYLAINTQEAGLGVRHYGLENLPGSKLSQLKEADPALTAPFTSQRLIQIPTDYVVSGNEKLKLVISRNR
jgi:hypothetical protein